jgi:hypothetical protein
MYTITYLLRKNTSNSFLKYLKKIIFHNMFADISNHEVYSVHLKEQHVTLNWNINITS